MNFIKDGWTTLTIVFCGFILIAFALGAFSLHFFAHKNDGDIGEQCKGDGTCNGNLVCKLSEPVLNIYSCHLPDINQ